VPLDTALLAIGLPALAAGIALGVRVGRGAPGGRAGRMPGAGGGDGGEGAQGARGSLGDARGSVDAIRLRSSALDVSADPILIVGSDGEVLDCNAAALTFLDRHRNAVIGAHAASLRTLWRDGVEAEWGALVAARAPWSGDALVRLPDGSGLRRPVHLVPTFGDGGEVCAMVEAYREGAAPACGDEGTVRQYLRALDLDEETPADGVGDDPADVASRELQRLALGVAALDRVVRQYERLVPAMRAEDPLTEVMAGLVVETRAVAESADVSRLLLELPRAVERLRHQLQRQRDGMASHAPSMAGAEPAVGAGRGTPR